eukprot:scaffold120508_cov63-Phaeocystis_antarctica.AAC.3
MRAADLIALRRCGGSAVLAFKERVDELSRLSAGRAEDEALLQQLSEKLSALTHDAASRLTEECRLRDEWRQERCKQAIGALPSASDDAANVDRMRDYVALLAPKGGTAAQLPWQRELLRQQQALARVLQHCPGGSGDRVRQALSEFMEHSRARLQQQLVTLQAQLKVHRQQQPQSQPQQPQQSPAAANGRRAAWGEAAVPSPEHACTTTAAEPKAAALGLTPEAFLEQMRRQHDAVRSLQAQARGRRGRQRFRSLVECRCQAAVRLQGLARGGVARRQATARRHALWAQECAALAERHSARRLQRAWRWSRRVRHWHRLWQPRAAARASDEWAVCTLQAAARGWRARTRARWWRRSLRRLHASRRAGAVWRARCDAAHRVQAAQTHAVLVQLHVAKEVSLLQREATREKKDFDAAFGKWAARLQKHYMTKKLHADWIPQMNTLNGSSYFFNLKTGESSEDHPNLKQVSAARPPACRARTVPHADGLLRADGCLACSRSPPAPRQCAGESRGGAPTPTGRGRSAQATLRAARVRGEAARGARRKAARIPSDGCGGLGRGRSAAQARRYKVGTVSMIRLGAIG